MDEIRTELSEKIETQGVTLIDKIDLLMGFKNRVIGMAIATSFIFGCVGSIVMHFMLK